MSPKQLRDDLVQAAWRGKPRLVLSALRSGANPNSRYRGKPVVMWAIQEGHLNAVKTLVRAGASIERRDHLGFTPLDGAVGEGSYEVVEFLLKAGAKPNARTRNGSALHTACAYRRLQIVKLLIKYGADVHGVDEEGKRPIDFTKPRTNRTDRAVQNFLKSALLK